MTPWQWARYAMVSEDYEGTTIGYLTDLTVPMVRLGVASKSRDPALYNFFWAFYNLWGKPATLDPDIIVQHKALHRPPIVKPQTNTSTNVVKQPHLHWVPRYFRDVNWLLCSLLVILRKSHITWKQGRHGLNHFPTKTYFLTLLIKPRGNIGLFISFLLRQLLTITTNKI